MALNKDRPTVLGVPFDTFTKAEVFARIGSAIQTRTFCHIVTPGPEFVMRAKHDSLFADTLRNAELSLADGIGIQFAAKALGIKGIPRITGNDLMDGVMERAIANRWRIYLFGSTRQRDLIKAASHAHTLYPGVQIVGIDGGFRGLLRVPEAIACWRIRRSKADVLFVAFGAPEQDLWIARNRHRLGNVAVAAGIGGAVVYLAGTMPRAPKVMRALGLEWLARLMVEPRRRWKRIIIAVVKFPWAVVHEKLRGGSNV